MKGLILAAGRGTRIQSVHGERPKCLIRFNEGGDTILDQQIENLFSAGVSNIGIVVGYQMNQILDHVRARHHKFQRRIQFFKNARFAETNNIYSLWLARDWLMDDSFVCLNADVVFDARVLTAALKSHRPITMIVDPEWRDETLKRIVTGVKMVRMSKGIPREGVSGTYPGITAISSASHSRVLRNVEGPIELGSLT